ncbi:D-alanyl-D-alanine carboxypeptidase/D-alanyl-D-alanine-endopeptidase [Rothia halotolerans]|uniref:D-alanyl-D-alanine carboxypeptidase/D-alanyl-D-alanine endopeptidase n=1 Tax=Rothia halotolerans TaxID=405770 RepID=UPI00101C15B8|nr:D-alanyl-D-alanine carboxypeptidase/D-alanyl-D-alanine-endopeptidase [Rothia halotolerans]
MSEQGARRGRGWWAAAAVLAVACLGVTAWLVPTAVANWDAIFFEASDGGAEEPDAGPVSPLPSDAPHPDAEQLGRSLDAALAGMGGGRLGARVVDVESGEALYSRDDAEPLAPASNLKVLTAFALLRHADPGDRYLTESRMGAEPGWITLVAGGDTMLSDAASDPDGVMGHAGLGDLAEQTVRSLREDGVAGRQQVRLDATRFTGPAVSPDWAPEDVETGYATGVHPIALWDHHTQRPTDPEDVSHRPDDAALDALDAYVEALNAAGAEAGLSFAAAQDPRELPAGDADGDRLGGVSSATVLEQAEYMMENSDNVLAEVLGRNAAVAAGEEGSLEGGVATIERALREEGVSLEGLDLKDLCGLAADDRVTAATLAGAVSGAIRDGGPASHLAETLPVAAGTGTLSERFDDPEEQAAAGYARAKTGTLLSVTGLTGYTTTSEGRLLAYSLVVNDLQDADAAREALDLAVAELTQA